MNRLAALALLAGLAATPAFGQSSPVPIPSRPDAPNTTPPDRVAPSLPDPALRDTNPGTGSGADVVPRGVVRPPPATDSGIVVTPPDPAPGTTRVIPPPGTPGGDPLVQPR